MQNPIFSTSTEDSALASTAVPVYATVATSVPAAATPGKRLRPRPRASMSLLTKLGIECASRISAVDDRATAVSSTITSCDKNIQNY